ncbi:hypothetical protein AAG570_010729 [Ranatra chinensis]|uniref:Uncharacterized protein n=1 Tax=Ranatra chinensis TaxID=642074 RepID=A0ABD0YZB4_9HEMI
MSQRANLFPPPTANARFVRSSSFSLCVANPRYILSWLKVTDLSVVLVKLSSGDPYKRVQHKVKCTDEYMLVELRRTDDISAIYLEGLKHYPEKGVVCRVSCVRKSVLNIDATKVLSKVNNKGSPKSVFASRGYFLNGIHSKHPSETFMNYSGLRPSLAQPICLVKNIVS